MECYRLEDLSFTYSGGDAPALTDLGLSVEEGEFITLLGPSGCGKTTLLRLLKPALAPHGRRQGAVSFRGRPLEELSPRDQAASIGFVLQSPEDQIVTHKVWHELAFGLESLGLPREAIRARVAEMASFFGLEEWFHRDTAALSGGQKQLLNLAAVMAMDPRVLLLDEPTSQLDPIAAQTFLDCLGRINRELGTTILLSEHRLEQALPLSHRCLLLEGGRAAFYGPPRELSAYLKETSHPMVRALPTPLRVWAACPGPEGPAPLTAGEGRRWLERYAAAHPLTPPTPPALLPSAPAALEAEEVWFRYAREGEDVLRGLSLTVPQGSLFAILGGNGVGKSTLLSLLSGALTPQRGRVALLGRDERDWGEERYRGGVAVLPQDPKALFTQRTLEADLALACPRPEELRRVAGLCRLEGLLHRHPYDLSGGELQRAALAKVLLAGPRVLLLDEPTKGMDAPFKEDLAALLGRLCQDGMTVVMVSHDGDFCASHATHCALLFDGTITAQGEPHAFFSQNLFYTTAASRMARDILPGAVTARELIAACGGREPPLSPPDAAPSAPLTRDGAAAPSSPASKRRWAGAVLVGLCLLAGFLSWQGAPFLAGLAGGQWLPSLLWLAAAALGLRLLGLGSPLSRPAAPPSLRSTPRALVLTALCLLVLVPATLLAGVYLLGDRKYYFISLLVLLEALAPVFLSLEHSRPSARLLVLLSALAALAAAGRAAFFMLPQFKPAAAVAVAAGVALGGQAGFLVGALSMLLSNFFYVQGAWTPWQMAAMGLIGLVAGLLGRWVGRGRLSLAAYGFFAVLVLYGGLLNPASVLMYQPHPTLAMVAAAWALGFPMDLVHAAAAAFFLWAGGPALLEQLGRLRTKYGLGDAAPN